MELLHSRHSAYGRLVPVVKVSSSMSIATVIASGSRTASANASLCHVVVLFKLVSLLVESRAKLVCGSSVRYNFPVFDLYSQPQRRWKLSANMGNEIIFEK